MLRQERIKPDEVVGREGRLEEFGVLELRGEIQATLLFFVRRTQQRIAGGRLAEQAAVSDFANVGRLDVHTPGFRETIFEFEERASDRKRLLCGGDDPGMSEAKVL